jgi:glucose/arabinose dehydrogenase
MAGVRIAFVVSFLALAACADTSSVPFEQQVGPDPVLPPPIHSLIPTVRVAEATGWPPGEMPVAASGWKVAPFATGLDHPRWLCVLPNGDVLVAETNAPERPEEGKGIRGWMTKRVMKKAGAGVPSANRITLLRDADRDGVAEVRSVFLERLNSPFGMALVGDELYVANTDAVLRFPYRGGETRIEAPGTKVVDLPAGPRNHHWTKNLIASRDGAKLYVTVGSNSNAAENGIEAEEGRAAIWEVDLKTKQHRAFATGLRNPNGLAFEPNTGALWTVVNERDEIGSDLVPDYVTSVKNGAFYGWPYSYYGRHVDDRVKPQRPDLVAKAVKPDYALGSHVAALGLAFSADGAFIGEHGSWNRSPPSGYKVVFVPFANGSPSGPPRDLLSGFLQDDKARGRPVGLALDSTGALLVADDVGNVIWRVTAVGRAVGR